MPTTHYTASDGETYVLDFEREPTPNAIAQVQSGLESQIAERRQQAQATAAAGLERGRLATIGNAAARSFVAPLASMTRGLGEMTDSPSLLRGAEQLQAGTNAYFPVNPEYEQEIPTKIVGSAAGLASGALPFLVPVAGEFLGPASLIPQTYDAGYQQAEAAGLPASDVRSMGTTNAIVQTPMMTLGGRVTRGLLTGGVHDLSPLRGLAVGTAEAGAIGGASRVGENLVAGPSGYNIDPNRSILDEVPQSAGYMAGGSALLGGIPALLRSLPARTPAASTTPPATPAPPPGALSPEEIAAAAPFLSTGVNPAELAAKAKAANAASRSGAALTPEQIAIFNAIKGGATGEAPPIAADGTPPPLAVGEKIIHSGLGEYTIEKITPRPGKEPMVLLRHATNGSSIAQTPSAIAARPDLYSRPAYPVDSDATPPVKAPDTDLVVQPDEVPAPVTPPPLQVGDALVTGAKVEFQGQRGRLARGEDGQLLLNTPKGQVIVANSIADDAPLSDAGIAPTQPNRTVALARANMRAVDAHPEGEKLHDAYDASVQAVEPTWLRATSEHPVLNELADLLDLGHSELAATGEKIEKNKVYERQLAQYPEARLKNAENIVVNTLDRIEGTDAPDWMKSAWSSPLEELWHGIQHIRNIKAKYGNAEKPGPPETVQDLQTPRGNDANRGGSPPDTAPDPAAVAQAKDQQVAGAVARAADVAAKVEAVAPATAEALRQKAEAKLHGHMTSQTSAPPPVVVTPAPLVSQSTGNTADSPIPPAPSVVAPVPPPADLPVASAPTPPVPASPQTSVRADTEPLSAPIATATSPTLSAPQATAAASIPAPVPEASVQGQGSSPNASTPTGDVQPIRATRAQFIAAYSRAHPDENPDAAWEAEVASGGVIPVDEQGRDIQIVKSPAAESAPSAPQPAAPMRDLISRPLDKRLAFSKLTDQDLGLNEADSAGLTQEATRRADLLIEQNPDLEPFSVPLQEEIEIRARRFIKAKSGADQPAEAAPVGNESPIGALRGVNVQGKRFSWQAVSDTAASDIRRSPQYRLQQRTTSADAPIGEEGSPSKADVTPDDRTMTPAQQAQHDEEANAYKAAYDQFRAVVMHNDAWKAAFDKLVSKFKQRNFDPETLTGSDRRLYERFREYVRTFKNENSDRGPANRAGGEAVPTQQEQGGTAPADAGDGGGGKAPPPSDPGQAGPGVAGEPQAGGEPVPGHPSVAPEPPGGAQGAGPAPGGKQALAEGDRIRQGRGKFLTVVEVGKRKVRVADDKGNSYVIPRAEAERARVDPNAKPRTSNGVPYAPLGQPDIIDHILDKDGGILGSTKAADQARKRGEPSRIKDLYDGREGIQGIYSHLFKGTQTPDQMATYLRDEHNLGDGGVQTMYDLIRQAIKSRQSAPDEAKRQKGLLKEQKVKEKQVNAFAADAGQPEKGDKTVNVNDLHIGQTVTVNGERLKVVAIDPDGTVELEDGLKYGKQELPDGATIYVEKVGRVPKPKAGAPVDDWDTGPEPEPAPAPEPPAQPEAPPAPAEDPKLASLQRLRELGGRLNPEAALRALPKAELQAIKDAVGIKGVTMAKLAALARRYHENAGEHDLRGTEQPPVPEKQTGPLAEIAAPTGPLPKLRSGENQGDLLSSQTEDLTLVGEKGIDYAAREAERKKAEQDAAEAKEKQDRDQSALFSPSEGGRIAEDAPGGEGAPGETRKAIIEGKTVEIAADSKERMLLDEVAADAQGKGITPLEYIQRLYGDGISLRAGLESVARQAERRGDDEHAALARFLSAHLGGDVTFDIRNRRASDPDFAGQYEPTQDGDKVTIYPENVLNRNVLHKVILHEAIHAGTARTLRLYLKGEHDALTPRQLAAARDLDALFQSAKEHAARSGDDSFYGLQHVTEFATEALTSKPFQEFLAKLPAAGDEAQGRSVWQKFKDAVKRMLGLDTTGTLLGRAMDAAMEVIEAGRPSKVASEDVTSTPEFRRWFGDSKVVDADGKPLVVTHQTHNEFDVFDRQWAAKGGRKTASPIDTLGNWFTDTSERMYGPRNMKVFLSIKNPLKIKDQAGKPAWNWLHEKVLASGGVEKFRAKMEAARIDGVWLVDTKLDGVKQNVFLAFHPEQIKSATDNSGAFDPNNPSILAAPPVRTRAIPPGATRADIERQAFDEIDNRAVNPGIMAKLAGGARRDLGAIFGGAAAAARDVRNALAPASAGGDARGTADLVRANTGSLYRGKYQGQKQLERAIEAFNSLKLHTAAGQKASIDIMDRIERGVPQADPAFQPFANMMRGLLEGRKNAIQALGIGRLEDAIKDYFPHIWKTPEEAASMYASILGKRPLEGPKGFLKERSIDFLMDGVAQGLEPVSWNPAELTLLKLHEMDRFLMAHNIATEMRDLGLAQPLATKAQQAMWLTIQSKRAKGNPLSAEEQHLFNVFGASHPLSGPLTIAPEAGNVEVRLAGQTYQVQADAGRIINNYLSPGLRGKALFDALRGAGNLLNQAQLGLSFFHAGFVVMDTTTSKAALGIEQIVGGIQRGDLSKAVKGVSNLGQAAVPGLAAVKTYRQGRELLRAYEDPARVSREMREIAAALQEGGGRVTMDDFYATNAMKTFKAALREGNVAGAVFRAPMAFLEAFSHPLMQNVVPRMKLGVFADLAREEIERLGSGASPEQRRAAFRKAWDTVDNRLGMIVYDNLFLNKALKDSLMLGVRSVGWNIGTIRELGGGALDANPLKIMARIKAGEPIITHQLAYTIALPFLAGVVGSILQFLHTGKRPEDLKDALFPRTGKSLPDGSPERLTLPTYIKDVDSYYKHPLQTVANKVNPLISILTEMYQNKDYYGGEIRNTNDPIVAQLMQEVAHVIKTPVPFAVTGIGKRQEHNLASAVESFVGVTPAPADISRTPAMNVMIEAVRRKLPTAGRTPEETQRADLRKQLLASAKSGQSIRPQVTDAIRSGAMTPQAAQRIMQDSRIDPRLKLFRALSVEDARKVYEVSNPQERRLFVGPLRAKEARNGAPLTSLASR